MEDSHPSMFNVKCKGQTLRASMVNTGPMSCEARSGGLQLARHARCSSPPKLIRLKCDYPAPEGLESSRTSNGPTQKAVRHPRGMLINYIFTGSSYDRKSTLKVGGIIQHPPEFCGSKILQNFKFYKQ